MYTGTRDVDALGSQPAVPPVTGSDPTLVSGGALLRSFEVALHELGIDAATVQQRISATIRPTSLASGATTDVERILSCRLELGEVLGEGGMGIVHAAREEILGRTVAVKTLKCCEHDPRSVRKLVQEAWVTGHLEHPNVVPVYRIEVGEAGVPRVVLKLIEGENWASLLHRPEEIERRFGASDPLEWNLRVLLSVCDALRLAHDRGVIHRDIKAENVMLGRYGEVYLVDWGLALAVDQRARPWLPATHDANQVAGTLPYMAPEQLEADGERIGVATDVYLLGATLCEIVVGAPPHRADNLVQVLLSVANATPVIPAHVPSPLATILRQAMQRDTRERYADVEAFARGVRTFLDHRSAHQLVERSEAKVRDLEAALQAGGSAAAESADRGPVYRLLGECRFGFRQALEMWPECDQAREGLVCALRAVIDFEIARESPQAAAALLAELPDPPQDLNDRVEALTRNQLDRQRELERIGRYLDAGVGSRARRGVILGLIAVWVTLPLALEASRRFTGAQRSHEGALMGALALLLVVAFLLVPAHQVLLRTAVNRQLTASAFVAVFAQVVLHAGAIVAHAPINEPLRAQYLPWFAITGVLSVTLDRWLVLPCASYVAAYFVVSFWPGAAFAVTASANFVLAAVLWFRWTNTSGSAATPNPKP